MPSRGPAQKGIRAAAAVELHASPTGKHKRSTDVHHFPRSSAQRLPRPWTSKGRPQLSIHSGGIRVGF
jgi:hypothetical protein